MPQLDLGKVVGDTGPQGPKGDQGIQGPAGPTGPGVAVGGSANQVLVKHSGTNYDTQWVDAGNLPAIAGVQDAIAIIADGDTHAAVAAGQAVYVRSHSTLAAGLYWATAAIGTNAALSTSNLTADGAGGLNKLKSDIDSLNSNFSNIGSTASTARATASRGSVLNGGAYLAGKLLVIQFTFKAAVSVTNSPGILNTDKTLPCDAALSAIDITSGIGSAIASGVPCGISTSGQVFIKELVTDHIYAISGVVRTI